MLDLTKYDFIDFGCSKGDSILHAQKMFGKDLKGLGIDIDDKKLKVARERGLDAFNIDILTIEGSLGLVDFVTMIHFLEHVPNANDVYNYIRIAALLSRKFILIRQPYFDADGYLFSQGLKLFWSDWVGHPNRMTSLEMYNVLRTLKEKGLISEFSIHVKGRIKDSEHNKIISIEAPIDSFEFDKLEKKIPRRWIRFDNIEVWSELVAIVYNEEPYHRNVLKKVRVDKTLFRSNKRL